MSGVLSSQEHSGYKFQTPITPNVKFTQQKDDKPSTSGRGRPSGSRGRQPRSRSNTRELVKKPPLMSVASDSALINSGNNVLLTQLLTNRK